MRSTLIRIALAAALTLGATHAARAEGDTPPLLTTHFSFQGVFGRYNPATLKRGFEVFHQICSNCHSLKRVAYRSLGAIGLTKEQIRKLAAERQVQDGPDAQGKMFMRPGKPFDQYIPPFPNKEAAAAAFGAAPPDLSLMAVEKVGGPDFIYSILNGFTPTPKGVTLPPGKFYNEYFPGHAISMPPPLFAGAVTYSDGTKATVPQMAHDVATFLNWAAQPNLDARKDLGIKVLIFVAVLTVLMYALKRQIWKNIH
jgi:cytochrome c1